MGPIKEYVLTALHCPNIDSPLFCKECAFESDNNTEAEFVLYTGDWNVTINCAIDNKNDVTETIRESEGSLLKGW